MLGSKTNMHKLTNHPLSSFLLMKFMSQRHQYVQLCYIFTPLYQCWTSWTYSCQLMCMSSWTYSCHIDISMSNFGDEKTNVGKMNIDIKREDLLRKGCNSDHLYRGICFSSYVFSAVFKWGIFDSRCCEINASWCILHNL